MTLAPTEPKLTIGSFASAPVSIVKSVAVSVRNEPSVIVSVSALNLNDLNVPSESNVNVARRRRPCRRRGRR